MLTLVGIIVGAGVNPSHQQTRMMLGDDDVTVGPLRAGFSTLDDVAGQIGISLEERRGVGCEERTTVCYKGNVGGRSVVVFFSSGTMAAKPRGLTSIGVSLSAHFPDAAGCAPTRLRRFWIRTRRGVGLGMKLSQMLKTLGNPTTKERGRVHYLYSSRIRMTAAESEYHRVSVPLEAYWDVTWSLSAEFENEALVRFEVGKTLSY